MSLAIPDLNQFAIPPIKAVQSARALRKLRWCLTRNTIRGSWPARGFGWE